MYGNAGKTAAFELSSVWNIYNYFKKISFYAKKKWIWSTFEIVKNSFLCN